MGEVAEMMLNGTMCQGCGEWLHDGEDGPGYPGYCHACAKIYYADKQEPKRGANKDFRGDEMLVGKKLLARMLAIEAKENTDWDYAVAQHKRLLARGLIRNKAGVCSLTKKGQEILTEARKP